MKDWAISIFVTTAILLVGLFVAATVKTLGRPDVYVTQLELPADTRKPTTAIYEFGPDDSFPPPPPEFAHLVPNFEEEFDGQYVYVNDRIFNEDDAECLAKNIYFESKNQSLKGQVAVALVTMNRVRSPYYPNTVCEVVYDRLQFSWYWDGKPDNPVHAPSYEQAEQIATAILSPDVAVADFTYGSDHYHADYVEPYWIGDETKMVRVVQIETHIFYRAVAATSSL